MRHLTLMSAFLAFTLTGCNSDQTAATKAKADVDAARAAQAKAEGKLGRVEAELANVKADLDAAKAALASRKDTKAKLAIEDPTPADKAAREVVEQYLKQFSAGDANGVMKVVAIPFLLGNGRKVLKDIDALRVDVEETCARQKKSPPKKFEVQSVKTPAAFESGDWIPRNIFGDVLDLNKDRMVQVTTDGFAIYFGVRIEKDAGKIVGLWETLR